MAFEATGGDLVQEPIRRITKLPEQQDSGAGLVSVIEKGNHCRGAGGADQFQLAGAAIWKASLVYVQFQHPPAIDSPRGDGGFPVTRSSGGPAPGITRHRSLSGRRAR